MSLVLRFSRVDVNEASANILNKINDYYISIMEKEN